MENIEEEVKVGMTFTRDGRTLTVLDILDHKTHNFVPTEGEVQVANAYLVETEDGVKLL